MFALNDNTGGNTPLNMTLGQAAQLVRQVDVKAQQYDKNAEEPSLEDFKVHIIDDLQDVPWFHATRKSNLDSIMKKGLLPSGEFEQGGGWTQVNLNLQNAVYLTASEQYAEQIADTLASRFGESAVVLQIDGNALMDKTKIVLDEDAILSAYDGMIDYGAIEHELPNYYTSVAKKIRSLGYAGAIPSKFISVVTEIEPENYGEDTTNGWERD